MACSLSSFRSLNQFFCRHNKLSNSPKIRSQGSSDNGKPANIVDENLSVLRKRIQLVRKTEMKRTHILDHTCGWNYNRNYDRKHKLGDCILPQYIEIMGLACGVIGLVFLIGSLTICFVSLLVN